MGKDNNKRNRLNRKNVKQGTPTVTASPASPNININCRSSDEDRDITCRVWTPPPHPHPTPMILGRNGDEVVYFLGVAGIYPSNFDVR